jgi:hypothetical protein
VRIRTADLSITNALLYQLSYSGLALPKISLVVPLLTRWPAQNRHSCPDYEGTTLPIPL